MSLREEDKAFEADVDFVTQREYLSQFYPTRNYFLDWLVAIYWELQGTCGPFEYATRVCVAKKIVEKVNTEHLLSSHMMLIRVVRNLFPYDKINDSSSESLKMVLGSHRGVVKKPKYRPLQDFSVKSRELITLRYKVLAEAFCSDAKNVLKLIRDRLSEEKITPRLNIVQECMNEAKQDITNLRTFRNQFYLAYPEEQLQSVSTATSRFEDTLKKRSELPKDMEPEFMYQMIMKYTSSVRTHLQKIMIESKEVCANIDNIKQVYYSEINELLAMCASIREYVSDGPFDEIMGEINDLGEHIENLFSYEKYLPLDILNDLQKGYNMYKNGFI